MTQAIRWSPNGTFVNEAAQYHVADPDGRSRGAVFFDANKDGWPDLFVSNYYPRPDDLPTPNRLYLNDHGTRFVSAPGYGLNQTVGGLALAPGCQQGATTTATASPTCWSAARPASTCTATTAATRSPA